MTQWFWIRWFFSMKGMALHLTHMNPLHERMVCAKFAWNCQVVLPHYMAEILPIWHKTLFNQSINQVVLNKKMWQSLQQQMMLLLTTADNGQILINKVTWAFLLRWAKHCLHSFNLQFLIVIKIKESMKESTEIIGNPFLSDGFNKVRSAYWNIHYYKYL